MGGSRYQRIRQTRTSFLSTNASSIHQKWNSSHRAQLNTSRGPRKSEKTRKIPAELGRTKGRGEQEEGKGRGEEVRWGLQSCGEMKARKGLHIPGSPSLGELSLDRRRASFSVGREHSNQHVAAGQSETCTQGTDLSLAHPALEAFPPMQTSAGC